VVGGILFAINSSGFRTARYQIRFISYLENFSIGEGCIMQVRSGKNFIIVALAVVLALGTFNWLSGRNNQAEIPATQAQTANVAAQPIAQPANDVAQSSELSDAERARLAELEEAYRAGYKDGREDAAQERTVTKTRYVRRASAAPRRGVAGVRYERNSGGGWKKALLTIGAPAAIGAGVGALAGGKKGAGAGALIGGGGGALYYLIKNKR
jgi:hypothetical protein